MAPWQKTSMGVPTKHTFAISGKESSRETVMRSTPKCSRTYSTPAGDMTPVWVER